MVFKNLNLYKLMKYLTNNYNRFVSIVLICTETALSGLLFRIIMDSGIGTKWEKAITAPYIQVMMTLMMIYALCDAAVGIVLFKRKVYAFEIVSKVSQTMILFSVASFIILQTGHYMDAWSYLYALYLVLLGIIICTERLVLRVMLKRYRTKGGNLRFVVLVGSSVSINELYRELTVQGWAGYRVIGYFDYEASKDMPEECRYLGKPEMIEGFLKENRHIHYLFCGLRDTHRDDIMRIIGICDNNLVRFYSVPNLHNYVQNRVYLDMVGSVPILKLRNENISRLGNQMAKRAFDLVFSTLFLCTLFPFILIIVTIVTKITMPGPVFFKQKRNGLNDKEFYCLKFRSMKVNADADKVQATKDDPRKTKWGNFMRKTSIDELPQFINVFMGDMSVVGPRPHMLKHNVEYSKLIDKYMVRNLVKPGVTGWSQVTGHRGETKELKDMADRIKGDIWYIENWSFWLDIYIIFKTVVNAIRGEEKAY